MERYDSLRSLGSGIWTVDGDWEETAFRRRMTILSVGSDSGSSELLLHSAIRMSDADLAQVEGLGRVAHIVVPNAFHGSDAPFYAERFAAARVYVPQAARAAYDKKMRVDGSIEKELSQVAPAALKCVPLQGTRLVHECALVHIPSKTLVLVDAVFNMKASAFKSSIERRLMSWNHVGDRFGPSWLMKKVFTADRARLSESMREILSLDFDRVVMSHGDVVESGGKSLMREAFSYLGK